MAKERPAIRIWAQETDSAHPLCDRLSELLLSDGLERFRVAVAYARWEGIALIAEALEAFIDGGGEFQAIYGVANGVTTPDALLYSLYLQELFVTHTYAGAIEDEYANSIFHPKFFEFKFSDRTIILVGSANLTGAGLLRNTELVLELEVARGDSAEDAAASAWRAFRGASQKLTLDLVRDLKKRSDLADERDWGENKAKSGKPRLAMRRRPATKPLFARVLDVPQRARRAELLAKLDPITLRPKRLFLQILPNETGGSATRIGYQIQLPTATLTAFFGVGANETREVTFRFGKEIFTVHLTHFENNTHRVRLRPLQDVPRPCIVVFQRKDDDDYKCVVVSSTKYARVLAQKCTEQTRAGARWWGIE
jgi:HKD family nuclease